MSIQFQFNEPKATQAAAVLLRLSGGRMHKMRLIKLLYFAEREAVRRWGRPITGDKPYCMDHGPILSHVLRLLRTELPASTWYDYILPLNNIDIGLKASPGEQLLSTGEIDVLQSVWNANRHKTTKEIRDESHRLPEYVEPIAPVKRVDLPWERIYECTGHSQAEIEEVFAHQEEEEEIRRILGNV